MAVNIDSELPSYFPQPPQPTATNNTFPSDLVADGRNFYTQIQFVSYTAPFIGSYNQPSGGMYLPIPRKLNDLQTVTWQEESLLNLGASIASSLSGRLGNIVDAGTKTAQAGGALAGLAANPFLFMMFKHPNFKQHTLTWTFAPTNEQESITLAAVIRQFKFHMLPTLQLGGLAYGYPSIALIKLYPSEVFTFAFKPCAVLAVETDFTGAGSPSYFKNGAPTVVNLTVQLKEIDLWTKNNYRP